MIKARDAKIFWNSSYSGRVYDVRVRERFDPTEQRICSSGAVRSAWAHARDTAPELVFAKLLFGYGFTTPEEARIALLQFAKIDSCKWARAMLDVESCEVRP